MPITLDGGAGVTYPDGVQQTNAVTNTGGNPGYYAARAWANINGSGSATLRAGANISAVSRVGTGRYQFTFATNMPDANYVVLATAGDITAGAAYMNARIYGTPTVSSFTVSVHVQSSGNPTYSDADYLNIVVFR